MFGSAVWLFQQRTVATPCPRLPSIVFPVGWQHNGPRPKIPIHSLCWRTDLIALFVSIIMAWLALRTPSSSVRAIFARLDADGVARQMDLAFRQLPGYARFVDDDPAHRGHPAIRWNVALVLRWLTDGVAPDESMIAELHEVVRVRAVAAEPMHDGLLVYRRGVRILWGILLDAATDSERPMLLEQAEILWSYLELVVDTFSQAYADAQDTPESVGERRAWTLLDSLCADRPITVEDRERAEHLGFDLAGPHRAFVARLAGATTARHIALASRLRSQGVLATTEGRQVAGLCVKTLTGPAAKRSAFPLRLRASDRAVASGPNPRNPQDARRFRRWREPRRTRHRARLSSAPAARAVPRDRRRHRRTRFRRSRRDRTRRSLATLRCLAANSFDRGASAAELIIHRNTVLYRIQRIQKLTGLDLQNPIDQNLVCLATLWTQIKPQASPGPRS